MRQAEPVSTTSSAMPAALRAARMSGVMKTARGPQPSTTSSVGVAAACKAAREASDRSAAAFTGHGRVSAGVTSTGSCHSRSLIRKRPGP